MVATSKLKEKFLNNLILFAFKHSGNKITMATKEFSISIYLSLKNIL